MFALNVPSGNQWWAKSRENYTVDGDYGPIDGSNGTIDAGNGTVDGSKGTIDGQLGRWL